MKKLNKSTYLFLWMFFSIFPIKIATASGTVGENWYVIASAVNLRDQARFDAKVIGILPIATRVEVRAKHVEKTLPNSPAPYRIEWMQVVVEEGNQKGAIGWIIAEFLVKDKPTFSSLLAKHDAVPAADAVNRRMWAERAIAMEPSNPEALSRFKKTVPNALPPPGAEFCRSLSLSPQHYANCLINDYWSIDYEDYASVGHVLNLEHAKQKAEKGDAGAQFVLATIYAGHTKQDLQLSVDWYRKSAQQGNLCAQHNLGLMYLLGRGVKQDTAEALQLIRNAAEDGLARSQRILWKIYFFGHGGVSRDYLNAVKWLRKAAVQGDPVAHSFYLRSFPTTGWGALYWKQDVFNSYHAAASKGDLIAQFLVGGVYKSMYGSGDLTEVVKWYRMAAEQGLIEAQNESIGALYSIQGSAHDNAEITKSP